jgi:predicted 2-oxoglutarate/Fe(II)-dependent dioxygenase YbiX
MLAPGDKMPFCAGVGPDETFYSFDAQAGRAAVLVLGGALPLAMTIPLVAALAGYQAAFAALQTDLALLVEFAGQSGTWRSAPGESAVPIIACQDAFFAACDAPPDAPMVVVIDRAARIVAAWPIRHPDAAAVAAAALQAAGRIPREAAADIALPAPVLAIPGLFDRALCRELIERFDTGATFEGGVSGADAAGQAVDSVNLTKKRRRDWLLQPGDGTHRRVVSLLFRRCAPEIARAFHCDVSHADRILVARYDESGGYFKRHRDNRGAAVAFRQFALSVNLNDGYGGGHLLFPEFNDHRYRPAAGEGMVFSCSFLHEAAPVTSGQRYVLLTFLHDAAAEAMRAAGPPGQ